MRDHVRVGERFQNRPSVSRGPSNAYVFRPESLQKAPRRSRSGRGSKHSAPIKTWTFWIGLALALGAGTRVSQLLLRRGSQENLMFLLVGFFLGLFLIFLARHENYVESEP